MYFLPILKYMQAHAPNKDDSKDSLLDQELSTLCMASICLSTYLQYNISYMYTRMPILNTVMFLWDGDGQTF